MKLGFNFGLVLLFIINNSYWMTANMNTVIPRRMRKGIIPITLERMI